MKLTRRSFLKVLGASAATIAVPQVLAKAESDLMYVEGLEGGCFKVQGLIDNAWYLETQPRRAIQIVNQTN